MGPLLKYAADGSLDKLLKFVENGRLDNLIKYINDGTFDRMEDIASSQNSGSSKIKQKSDKHESNEEEEEEEEEEPPVEEKKSSKQKKSQGSLEQITATPTTNGVKKTTSKTGAISPVKPQKEALPTESIKNLLKSSDSVKETPNSRNSKLSTNHSGLSREITTQDDSQNSSRKKASRDPNLPKRPTNATTIYLASHYEELENELSEKLGHACTKVELINHLREKLLSDSTVKSAAAKEFTDALSKYNEEMEKYKEQNPDMSITEADVSISKISPVKNVVSQSTPSKPFSALSGSGKDKSKSATPSISSKVNKPSQDGSEIETPNIKRKKDESLSKSKKKVKILSEEKVSVPGF